MIKKWNLIVIVLSAINFAGCPRDIEGPLIVDRSGEFSCNTGFTMNAGGDVCLCEPPRLKFGNAACYESIDPTYSYASLEGCPGAMAIKLTGDFQHEVNHEEVLFDRMKMFFIQPRPTVDGIEISETSYLRRKISEEVDSIIFSATIGSYYSLDTLEYLPEFLFHGIRTDSATLEGTMSWGPYEDYWKITEAYGSCRASFRLIGE